MKNPIILSVTSLVLALLFIGCANRNTYTVNGQIGEAAFNGETVYLGALESDEILDSTVVENGQFTFKGEVTEPRMAVLTVYDRSNGNTASVGCRSILVLEHGKISIDLITDSLGGTPLNDQLFSTITSNAQMKRYHQQMEQFSRQYGSAEDDEAREEARACYNQVETQAKALTVDLSRQIYSQNLDNVLGAYALNLMVENDGITFDSLDILLAKASPAIAGYAPLRQTRTTLFHLNNTSVGRKYTDLKGINYATGKTTKLSNMIKNDQVTLIDFWASWCGPCRNEISNYLLPLYENYKDNGLNIIGIDISDDLKKHDSAVKELNIPYPQLIDTTSNTTVTYAVQTIPLIMLLDKNGIILERGLRGDAIEQAVIKALGIEPLENGENENGKTDNEKNKKKKDKK